jgi:hypothetical protein
MQIDGSVLIGYTDWERKNGMIGLSIIVKLSRSVWGLTATIKLSATS